MKIRIIAIGKIKEKFFKQGIAEYEKRMQSYLPVEIIELKDEPAGDNLSEAEKEMVLAKEGERILNKIGERDYVINLAIEGKKMDSEEFSAFLFQRAMEGVSNVDIVIGGSFGLSDTVKKRGNQNISFSDMTFPHQLMRLILMEQLYRACRIEHGHSYHK
ncbi:23S rRNA (pseudouridine(1915)-N(3))-methyltransferase RlmH [Peptoniphilus sp. KCTC 25270]|uniref:23S rRNA (pseudouridine(1915)-N(3))-methyltransferase RlmH n=1 Tax=Peptoniphilus sp. KCTC 25270 TaxID=2897414 RepID=UPI001E5EDF3F|nr:23S rRNA (pseudouridine(1915)-N(3))-methyltransferase RlmH [Peptoniphilus sp. KCTC 25270]MCD1147736.1 23S rRNA (pseudouridine(1915)-N(3))-methyltransferase RlmH [Peptoniphilus sp. KCTC 25270]